MSIYLIRHGETAFNRERIVQLPETPLSDAGLHQAQRLGARLVGQGIVHILASDMARAATTAECVSQATGLPVEHEPLLQERNLGDIRGTPYSELAESPFGPHYAPPNGETWATFHARVDTVWERVQRLASSLAGHLAVVTHGLVLHSIATRIIEPLDLPEAPGPNGPIAHFGNTAVTILEGPEPWRATLFNCTSNLDEAQATAPI